MISSRFNRRFVRKLTRVCLIHAAGHLGGVVGAQDSDVCVRGAKLEKRLSTAVVGRQALTVQDTLLALTHERLGRSCVAVEGDV